MVEFVDDIEVILVVVFGVELAVVFGVELVVVFGIELVVEMLVVYKAVFVVEIVVALVVKQILLKGALELTFLHHLISKIFEILRFLLF